MNSNIFNIDPGFDQGVSNVLSLYEPQEPSYTILDSLVPQGPQAEMNPSGLRDAMGRVIGELQTGNQKINDLSQKRDGLKTRMYELLAKRGGVMPEQAQQMTQDPKEALIAGLIALAAAQGGARNAIPAFNQFMGTRQGQIAGQNEQAQMALNQEYQRRMQELQSQAQMLDMEMQDATTQLGGLQTNQQKLIGEYSDLAQAGETTNRTQMNNETRLTVKQLEDESKRYAADLASQDKRGKELFDIVSSYEGYRKIGFSDEEARALVASDPQYKIAQTENTEARTQTENELRQGKVDKLLSEIKVNDARADELRKKIEKHAESIDNEADEQVFKRAIGLVDADIGVLKADLGKLELDKTDAKAAMDALKSTEKLPGGMDAGYKAAKAEYDRIINSINDIKRQIQAKEKDKAVNKQSQANAPFLPPNIKLKPNGGPPPTGPIGK